MPVLVISRGTTFAITVEYRRNGTPASLVGSTIRFTVKANEFSSSDDDSDALLKYDVTNGDDDGHAVITIVPADTKSLAPGNYFYDIKVEDADGNVYKLDEGGLRIDASPTNRLSP
jgi:hypothetical protein